LTKNYKGTHLDMFCKVYLRIQALGISVQGVKTKRSPFFENFPKYVKNFVVSDLEATSR